MRATRWLALACLVLSVAIFVRRGFAAAELTAIAPGVADTSGYERESFFALWRAVHDQPVYGDVSRLPYASAYFNWLFYAGYAVPLRAAVGPSGDAVIPLAGRLVTAVGALVGVAGLFWLLRRVLAGRAVLAAALASFVFFGPLVGWFAHTVRPDLWALALETSALAVLLLHYRPRPLTGTVLACLLFYAAWSLKQTYVVGLGTALLFLLYRRQWRPAGLLTLGSIALWVATFAAMGPAYRAAFQGTVTNNYYYPALGLEFLRDMLVKTSPLWLLAAPFVLRRKSSDAPATPPLAADAAALGLIGLGLALPLGLAASSKLGASSYYYFPVTTLLALLAAASVATRPASRLIPAGLALACGLQSLVFLGRAGKISLAESAHEMAATWSAWENEPAPRYAHLAGFNLPWLNPGSPPLVLAYNYSLDRAAHRPFENDGVGGLISAGYFRSLLLPATTEEFYDGGSLDAYVRGETINGSTVFRRRSAPVK